MGLESLGKMLLIGGGILALVGLIVIVTAKIGFTGRLPGDILIQRGNFTFYFPLVTFIIVSLVLTVAVNLILRLLR